VTLLVTPYIEILSVSGIMPLREKIFQGVLPW
ncbi:hypothetical protein QIQ06_gp1, partial [ssRNA phage SRR7976325_26]